MGVKRPGSPSPRFPKDPGHDLRPVFDIIELDIFKILKFFWGIPGGSEVKISTCNVGEVCSIPGSRRSLGEGKTPWRRKWQPTSVFLPGKSHGPRSLVGYTVHGVTNNSDMT